MPRPSHRTGDFSREEMAELVGVFIDETDTQCDQLVESLLALEKDPAQAEQIAIAFRMVHSIKGSAGMLGFDPITAVAHQLESHFERLRSGTVVLDRRTVEAALACIDYFRDCTERLAQAAPLNHGESLIEAVKGLAAAAPITAPPAESAPASTPTNTADERQR
jgi:two-component system chemotaxis sensor kinase CheA